MGIIDKNTNIWETFVGSPCKQNVQNLFYFCLIIVQRFIFIFFLQRIAGGAGNPWDYRSWSEHHSHHGKWLQYPEIRSSGPVCGLDPAWVSTPSQKPLGHKMQLSISRCIIQRDDFLIL